MESAQARLDAITSGFGACLEGVEVTSCTDSSVEWQLAIGAPMVCERNTLERGVVPMLVDIGASLLLHALGRTEALHMSLNIEYEGGLDNACLERVLLIHSHCDTEPSDPHLHIRTDIRLEEEGDFVARGVVNCTM